MNRITLAFAIVAFSTALSGCCALNAGIDPREEFIRKRTAQVGKVVDVSSVHPAALRTEPFDSETTRYIIGVEGGACLYEYRVSNSSRIVQSWHYISPPEKCTANRYYCGAW